MFTKIFLFVVPEHTLVVVSMERMVIMQLRKYYTDKEVFYSELENIFYENWFCIGRSNEINNKGSYITIDIGSESLIVVRDVKNLLKGFFNV